MNGPIAWVTGGGTGIGRALAEQLYKDGYRILISGRRKDVLLQAAAEIGSQGRGDVLALEGDVSDPAYVRRTVDAVRQRWGDIDLLINNAGIVSLNSFQKAEPKEYLDVFTVNCFSAVLCSKMVLPAMLARRAGAIINVSSILGKWASVNSSSYSVSKYALAGFTDALRQELLSTGVHVMGVYPGFICTAMTLPQLSENSWKTKLGASPESMARAILHGLRNKKREVLYPFYVPWVLRLHRWFPGTLEGLRQRLKD